MLSQIETHQSIIITGGNSGLGYQCAKAIAQSDLGWHIIIASRNLHRVESSVSRLITETSYHHVQGLELDLASLQMDMFEEIRLQNPMMNVKLWSFGTRVKYLSVWKNRSRHRL